MEIPIPLLYSIGRARLRFSRPRLFFFIIPHNLDMNSSRELSATA